MTVITVTHALTSIAHGLREGFFMFWATLWALVLGFALSGAVQAFVSKLQMRRRLGDHRTASVARASGYGMVSSSCSYAATAMAKSLVAKGADFTTSMVFMFASTNLVIELGIVMLVLLGWQFTAAEFVGGPIMIALLALVGGAVFTTRVVAVARRRASGEVAAAADANGHEHHGSGHGDASRASADADEPQSNPRSVAGWSDAASYALADATMLRKELVIGYSVAGLLAVLVPQSFWNSLFMSGHGFWSSLENVLVGPAIAIISWVCSIGNVPLAAALWSGGISFGGVIAFIFADLIAMPLLIIYRKFYGTRMMWRMLLTFYGVMALAGLLTEGLFSALHLIPPRTTISPASSHFSWNYTTFLNIVFLALAGVIWWLARHRDRFGGGTGYAIDPVCAMQVRIADAPATARHHGVNYYFCSDRCRDRFDADPHRHGGVSESMNDAVESATDPVCGMTVDPATSADHRHPGGVDYWFCSTDCAAQFDDDPSRFIGPDRVTDPMRVGTVALKVGKTPAQPTSIDPICAMPVPQDSRAVLRFLDDSEVWFCSSGCADTFEALPASERLAAVQKSQGVAP